MKERMLMKSNMMFLLFLASTVLPAGKATAAVVTVAALKDAMIFGTSAGVDTGNASGKGPALFAGADGSSNRKRSLVAFDIGSAGIPANATIESVTMTLYLAQVAGSGGGSGGGGNYPSRTFRVFALQQDWGEGNSGSPTNPGVGGTGQGYARVAGDSTWDYAIYNPANPTTGTWNSAGTNLHGGNFAPSESGNSTFTNFLMLNAPFTWSSAGMAADVQKWATGSAPNNGWLIKSDLEDMPTSFLGFWTKDGAAANNNPAIAPSLSITYSVPEPAGASLVIVCGVATLLIRKRRKI
jgi:hypothetical protein